jgi:hypothetical protein
VCFKSQQLSERILEVCRTFLVTLYKEQAVTKSKSAAVCQLSSGLRKNNKKSQAFMDEAEGCIKKTAAGQPFISDKRRRK